MEKDTQEKMPVKANEESVFYRIKGFFKNLFSKIKGNKDETKSVVEEEITKKSFAEYIRNITDGETELLDLQAKYRNGEIKEEDLTEEQVDALCELYDKQIEALRRSNEMKLQKILEYRKKL